MAIRTQQIFKPDPFGCWNEDADHLIRVNLWLFCVSSASLADVANLSDIAKGGDGAKSGGADGA